MVVEVQVPAPTPQLKAAKIGSLVKLFGGVLIDPKNPTHHRMVSKLLRASLGPSSAGDLNIDTEESAPTDRSIGSLCELAMVRPTSPPPPPPHCRRTLQVQTITLPADNRAAVNWLPVVHNPYSSVKNRSEKTGEGVPDQANIRSLPLHGLASTPRSGERFNERPGCRSATGGI